MLHEREMSFDEIVAATGKAKSTVSVHLKGLAIDEIIGSRENGHDARKKIFFIRSNFSAVYQIEKR